MGEFNANMKNEINKKLVLIMCIALILALAVIFHQLASSDTPAPSISIDMTEVSGATSCSADKKMETDATTASEPNQIGTSEPGIPDTETTEPVMTDLAPAETKENSSIEETVPTEPLHSHSYSSTFTKEATCTDTGVKTYTCACGDSYTKGTSALGHKYEKNVVQPTNSAQGYTQHTCIRCNDSYKTNYTDPLVDPNHVHNYAANVVAPNCYSKGYTTYTCSCGRTYKDLNSTTQPLGHTWGEWTDCGDGSSTKDCLICGRKWFKVNENCATGYYSNDAEYYEGLLVVGGASSRTDPNGDPNGDSSDYVAPADPTTGISWDGASPVIYTYADGSTGKVPKLGATFYVKPYIIGTVDAYTLGWVSNEEYFGGGTSDGYCHHCGKQSGDGINGTCIYWMVDGKQTCKHCGTAVPGKTCHTCPED